MASELSKKVVVFTDLDGTLLDASSYSFTAAVPALRLLHEREIPLVICSSKTRTEIEHYRRLLDNHHPFITENGGGIFIPAGYFVHDPETSGMPWTRDGNYKVINLGTPYLVLREALRDLKNEGFDVTGFGDMTAGEVAEATGLALGSVTSSFTVAMAFWAIKLNKTKLCAGMLVTTILFALPNESPAIQPPWLMKLRSLSDRGSLCPGGGGGGSASSTARSMNTGMA